ncbi:ATP-binding cassette domain-containing protein [Bacillus sp. B-TM1]
MKKGETLGIVGRTGAGKTTLLKCLIREYDHFNGELKVGERDIRDVTLYGVRSAISLYVASAFPKAIFSPILAENKK